MAVYELAVDGDIAHQSFETELDGTLYIIELRWNNRANSWFLSLHSSATGAPLVAGRRVVTGHGLLRRHKTLDMPPGDIVAVDTTGAFIDPGPNDLGRRVRLVYLDAAELAR